MKNTLKGLAIGLATLAMTAVVATAAPSPETALETSPTAAKELTVQLKVTGMT